MIYNLMKCRKNFEFPWNKNEKKNKIYSIN